MVFEAEVRSLISEEKYKELILFFRKNAEPINEDYQETYYFDAEEDLRIQKNSFFSKIWLKKGKLHEECREEIEVKFRREEFEKLEKLFLSLGYNISIKWFRTRNSFRWRGVNVNLDCTKGYGYIIEIEQLCEENEKDAALAALKRSMAELKIDITPKEEFDKKFAYYKENWRSLI